MSPPGPDVDVSDGLTRHLAKAPDASLEAFPNRGLIRLGREDGDTAIVVSSLAGNPGHLPPTCPLLQSQRISSLHLCDEYAPWVAC